MSNLTLESKFLGGMVGSALGDAIGEGAFAFSNHYVHQGAVEVLRRKIKVLEQLVYTDDTAMAIGIAESLTAVGKLETQHLGDTFRANFEREPWRGYAMGPPAVFRMVQRMSLSYPQAARMLFDGNGSFGNGAAMRIAPVGLFFHKAGDLYEQATLSAAVTHAHPIGIDGAAVLAQAVAQAVALEPRQEFPVALFTQKLIDFARTPEIREKMVMVAQLLAEKVWPDEAAHQLGRTVAVHESMPFAVYSFLRHPKSYEDCLFCAVLNGGDRDTLGAMACAISGAYLGIDAVPREWQDKLENLSYIEELARNLARLCDGVFHENSA